MRMALVSDANIIFPIYVRLVGILSTSMPVKQAYISKELIKECYEKDLNSIVCLTTIFILGDNIYFGR